MRSYFENRENRVKLGNVTSDWKKMERGCPQGSCLGPIIWNIFQNDLALNVNKANLTMYADDHQIYAAGRDLGNVKGTIQREGELAAAWYKDNYLLANADKFQAMLIYPRRLNEEDTKCDLMIQGENIENSDHIRLFGVDIDINLTFNKHISKICKKASKKVAVLTRFCNLASTKAKLQIYKSFILPNLTYCHTVWHFSRASDCRKIERVQEKALRAIFKSKAESYEDLLRRADLPSLRNRRLQDILIQMYKVKHNIAPKHLSDIFTVKEAKYSLRNSDFNIPRFNTVEYGKHSIRYFGPFIWSKLGANIRKEPTLERFKKIIRKINVQSLIENNDGCCTYCMS